MRQVPNDPKSRARRERRAADSARWRSRKRRGVRLFKIEIGRDEERLAVRFGGLQQHEIEDKAAVATGLGKLLRRGLIALLQQEDRRR